MILVYDVLRVFRRLIKHGIFWVAVEDMIYLMSCALLVFAMLYQKNDGLIRWFAIAGIAIGMLLYNHFISSWAVRGIVWILKKIINLLTYPLRLAKKGVQKPLGFCKNKILRLFRKARKLLKKIGKAVKIGLCKL
jgi:spore cortex biosynthesis protein YabQ